jgi:histidinol-phosphate phosphatase family protein
VKVLGSACPATGVIVAGGLATRMGEATARVPKAMLPIGGRPVLAHQLEQFRRAGIERVVVLAGHLAEAITHAGAWLSSEQLRVEILTEAQALGSGGCLRLLERVDGPLIVVFGDILFDVDLRALLACHREAEAWATIAVHPNEHPHDSDLVEIDESGRVLALHRKPHPPDARLRNLVVAALFVVEPEFVAEIPPLSEQPKLDFVHDLLERALARGRKVQAWRTSDYLKDIGTPRRYAEAREDLARGIPASRRRPRPTVFLDRDGTINRHVGHVRRAEQLELLPGAAEAIARLNRANVQVVVVTNQPVVARGECDEAGLADIHAELETQLGRAGAFVDRILHCPHHPDAGFIGERAALKIACTCRKPQIGLINRAEAELRIDRSASMLIGDTERDLDTAVNAGLLAILVGPGARALAERRGVRWYVDLARACAVEFAEHESRCVEVFAC